MKNIWFSVALGIVFEIAANAVGQEGGAGNSMPIRIASGETATRRLIEQSLDTQYCGFAMVEAGIGPITALTGKSPLGTGGFAKAEGEDWLPVALSMGQEDLECLKTLHDVLSAEDTDSGKTEAEVREQIDATFDHLSRLTMLLGHASGHASEVLDFLETVGKTQLPGMQCGLAERLGSPQAGYWRVWVRLSDLDSEEGIARCLAAGEKYAAEFGFGSQGNLAFCLQWLKEGAPRCHWEKGYAQGARHVLKSIGHFGQHKDCSLLDNEAANGGLAGWVGSIQRRRMAERFLDLQPVVRQFDKEKNEYVEEVWESLRPALLSFRAAAELAADEKDLTDLREVYGAWASDDDATDTKSPLTNP